MANSIKWGNPTVGTAGGDITWSFAQSATYNGINFLGEMGVYAKSQVREAFDMWEAVLDINFVEVAITSAAAVRVGFSNISTGDAGLATRHWSGSTYVSAEVEFDLGHYGGPSGPINFYALALHEIGHVVGLEHTSDPTALMNHNFTVDNLKYDDINAAVALYGARNPPPDAAGNFFTATRGNDTFNGQGGIDTVYFGDHSSAVDVQRSGSGLVVTGNGTDHFTNVERVAFQDAVLAFDTDGNAGRAYRIYQAAFDRTPDEEGLGYWVRQMDDGKGLGDVAAGFVASQEFMTVYGGEVSNADFIDRLYQNVLGRNGEAGGVTYWEGQLAAGTSKAIVLAGFSESPENIAGVAPAIADGIWYA